MSGYATYRDRALETLRAYVATRDEVDLSAAAGAIGGTEEFASLLLRSRLGWHSDGARRFVPARRRPEA